MAQDPEVAYLLPINPDTLDLCAKVKDGVLLSKFINMVVPDTIDMRAVNLPKGGRPLSLFQVTTCSFAWHALTGFPRQMKI